MDGEHHADFETGLTKDDKLDLRVWLRLLSCANRIEQAVRQGLRQEFGVTLPRFDVLSQLDRAPEGLTMGALSRRLMVTNGNVTGMVDRLVGEGLVERQPSPSDRRAQMVRMTPAGKAAFAKMIPEHQALVEQQFEGLSRADLRSLHALLGELKDSIKKPQTPADRREKN
jgi:DNA-binding MarR family transcriptional regulator